MQLHARIRENELRAQQVLQSQRTWFDDPHLLNTKVTLRMSVQILLFDNHTSNIFVINVTTQVQLVHQESALRTPCKQPSDVRLCCDEELGRKLAVAELEVLHLNDLFKQVTQKYTEDIRKLEEKVQKVTKTELDPQQEQKHKPPPPFKGKMMAFIALVASYNMTTDMFYFSTFVYAFYMLKLLC